MSWSMTNGSRLLVDPRALVQVDAVDGALVEVGVDVGGHAGVPRVEGHAQGLLQVGGAVAAGAIGVAAQADQRVRRQGRLLESLRHRAALQQEVLREPGGQAEVGVADDRPALLEGVGFVDHQPVGRLHGAVRLGTATQSPLADGDAPEVLADVDGVAELAPDRECGLAMDAASPPSGREGSAWRRASRAARHGWRPLPLRHAGALARTGSRLLDERRGPQRRHRLPWRSARSCPPRQHPLRGGREAPRRLRWTPARAAPRGAARRDGRPVRRPRPPVASARDGSGRCSRRRRGSRRRDTRRSPSPAGH